MHVFLILKSLYLNIYYFIDRGVFIQKLLNVEFDILTPT